MRNKFFFLLASQCMVLCHSCLKWLRTTTKTKSKLIAWIYMLTWYHLVGRKTRKPPEPVTTNIPVLCLLSLSHWGSHELLEGQLVFFSSFCFIVWGLVCCQGRVCVCGWVNKLWRNILIRVVFLAWTAVEVWLCLWNELLYTKGNSAMDQHPKGISQRIC